MTVVLAVVLSLIGLVAGAVLATLALLVVPGWAVCGGATAAYVGWRRWGRRP